jgi:hypothetical protein
MTKVHVESMNIGIRTNKEVKGGRSIKSEFIIPIKDLKQAFQNYNPGWLTERDLMRIVLKEIRSNNGPVPTFVAYGKNNITLCFKKSLKMIPLAS